MKKQTLLITIILVTFSLLVSCKKSDNNDNPAPSSNNPSDTTKHTTSSGDTTITGTVTNYDFYYFKFNREGSEDSLTWNANDSWDSRTYTDGEFNQAYTSYVSSAKAYMTSIQLGAYQIYNYLPNKKADFNKFVKDSLNVKAFTTVNKQSSFNPVVKNGVVHITSPANLEYGYEFVNCEGTVTKVLYIRGTNDVIVEGNAIELIKKWDTLQKRYGWNKKHINYRIKITLAD